ncbi:MULTISPECIES: family 43 glycosylhydrolase [Sphingomonas]|uniref:Family 43 glycosylhydrolase n=1 Tax=Sphingomonas molluscorum TaxID=418184 RepID=A0ABU8Q630_9SPHN|nr:family 43 glycosylhydrolase [Sphingomonas sp. JUb134]MBM7406332.1 beta-xylosidase [Sphingomonas sp. JUb134]
MTYRMLSHHCRSALAGAAIALLLSATAGVAQDVPSVFAGADPSAMVAEGKMWIYPTGGDGLQAWSTTDRRNWKKDPLLRLRDIRWTEADGAPVHYLWAPDMVLDRGRYYFYYSIGPQNPTPSRLGVAVCSSPAGPCTDSGKPLLTGGDGFEAIDPTVFIDPKSGRRLLYAGGSAGAKLRVFELAPNMVTIAREVPVEQPPHFTEGAFVHERNGIYYLSYSHGRWNRSDYSVHYATASSPIGPWQYRGAILTADAKYKGPGHHSFVRDPKTGEWLIVYHRWEGQTGDGPYAGERRVAIQPIRYDASGLIQPVKMSD